MNKALSTSLLSLLALAALVPAGGCLAVKTEHEVKPIHITMDVNLKVDKELDKVFGEEDRKPQQGAFKADKEMLDRGAAGVTNLALLEPREGATDDDRILVAEDNMRRKARYEQIARDSGVSVETVQKRRAEKLAEVIPPGSGVWIQDASGAWSRK